MSQVDLVAQVAGKGMAFIEGAKEVWALKATDYKNMPSVAYPVDSHPMDGRISIAEDGVVPTLTDKLRKGSADGPLVLIYRPTSCNCTGYEDAEVSASLTTKYHYGQGGDAALIVHEQGSDDMRVYSVENHPADSRVRILDDDKVQTLSSRMGTGGNNVPLVLVDNEGEEDMNYFDMQRIGQYGDSGTASTLKERDYKDSTDLIVENISGDNVAGTLDASYYKGAGARSGVEREVVAMNKHIIRRLTPLECCRLQGFPDWWEEGVEGSDSARYRMWGNGVCLQNCYYILNQITRYEEEKNKPKKEYGYRMYKYSSAFDGPIRSPKLISTNIADADEACKVIHNLEDEVHYIRICGPMLGEDEYRFDYGSWSSFYVITKKDLMGGNKNGYEL